MSFSQQCTHSATHRSSFKLGTGSFTTSVQSTRRTRPYRCCANHEAVCDTRAPILIMLATVYVWIKKKKNWSFCNERKKKRKHKSETDNVSEHAVGGQFTAVGPAADKRKRKREKTRKYTDNYLKFGFTFKETDGIEFPMCVICSTVLSNESMKPSKLLRHLETTHSHIKDKPVDYFKTCLKSLQGQQTLMKTNALMKLLFG